MIETADLWVVTQFPPEYPGYYVARNQTTNEHVACSTLALLQAALAQKGLVRQNNHQLTVPSRKTNIFRAGFTRLPKDHPKPEPAILEVWA